MLAGLLHVLAHSTTTGESARDSGSDIATTATKSSAAAWQAGHLAARPRLLSAARIGRVVGGATDAITVGG
ncbi:hypothetical protein FHR81_004750 [Actinoalloteichus hoggarensis]|uniref:Uncharacterized protein n=1 Tax=Actinoalloteichus hoggarensis TaxID=1470176 RepID=A0A221W479_9PSEU|nr:hypothetical protein AHOG_14985 [Actinoalloteichus hoggarensis]MBB5923679.1 hypothetical protein [Actinoalloteichus hoggarensis]